jgi:hypothetical protein
MTNDAWRKERHGKSGVITKEKSEKGQMEQEKIL